MRVERRGGSTKKTKANMLVSKKKKILFFLFLLPPRRLASLIKSSHIDLDVPYVVSGRSFVVSDTEEVVGSVLVPNTAPEEAKTKRGGDDDVEEEEEVEGRDSIKKIHCTKDVCTYS